MNLLNTSRPTKAKKVPGTSPICGILELFSNNNLTGLIHAENCRDYLTNELTFSSYRITNINNFADLYNNYNELLTAQLPEYQFSEVSDFIQSEDFIASDIGNYYYDFTKNELIVVVMVGTRHIALNIPGDTMMDCFEIGRYFYVLPVATRAGIENRGSIEHDGFSGSFADWFNARTGRTKISEVVQYYDKMISDKAKILKAKNKAA